MKLKDHIIQSMLSNKEWLLGFYYGFRISADEKIEKQLHVLIQMILCFLKTLEISKRMLMVTFALLEVIIIISGVLILKFGDLIDYKFYLSKNFIHLF